MTTIFFEESTGKQALNAIFDFLTSFKAKPIAIKKEKTLEDFTRKEYLDSIMLNHPPISISKSFKENYGKI